MNGSGDIKGPSKKQVEEVKKNIEKSNIYKEGTMWELGKDRPKPDPKLNDKLKKQTNYFGPIFFVICLLVSAFMIGSMHERKYGEPQIVYEKGEEIVKYVEKSKTPTKDFLTHLNPDVDPELAEVIARSIDKSSEKYQLPRKLICSIIKHESNVNPFAKSRVNAVGLMQVMPNIHKQKIGDRNLWHITTNVDVGCHIFKEYLDLEKGNLNKTFHRYLSKNATQSQLDSYTSGIYRNWSKLEMYDYLSTQERHENENGNGDFTIHPEQTESQPVEPARQTE